MAATTVRAEQIKSVKRADLDVTTSGSAVCAKIVAGTGVSLSSTGPDDGTGDVTVNAGSTPQIVCSFSFENTNRYTILNNNGASGNFSTSGVALDTSSTAGGNIEVYPNIPWNNYNPFSRNSIFSAMVNPSGSGSSQAFFIGVGAPTVSSTGITYTGHHYGFKRDITSSVDSWFVTCGDGTTENSASFTALSTSETSALVAVKSGSSIKFYVNGTLVATLSSNLPTAAPSSGGVGFCGITNKNVATDGSVTVCNMTFEQDAY